jgi:hypothetical protein
MPPLHRLLPLIWRNAGLGSNIASEFVGAAVHQNHRPLIPNTRRPVERDEYTSRDVVAAQQRRCDGRHRGTRTPRRLVEEKFAISATWSVTLEEMA